MATTFETLPSIGYNSELFSLSNPTGQVFRRLYDGGSRVKNILVIWLYKCRLKRNWHQTALGGER